MIVVFVVIGIILGILRGLELMEEAKPDIDILAIPLATLVWGVLFYIVGLLVKAIISVLIPFCLPIISFIASNWLPIIGTCAFVASAIYAATHPDEMKLLYAHIKRLVDSVVSQVKMSDHVISRYAIKQTKRLMAITPDIEWLDIRTTVSELGTRHIAQLLRERKSLRQAIKRIQGVLKQVEWQKPDRGDIEKANARRSAQTVEVLVVRLQKNEEDIAEALDALHYLEADLAGATIDAYRRDEITAKLRGLVSRIQTNSTAVQDAHTETDDFAQGRIRRLTE